MATDLRSRLEMFRMSPDPSRRHWWRLALLVLVTIPFLPEIAITAIALLARALGCEPDQQATCVLGPLRISDIITLSLQAGTSVPVAGLRISYKWLVLLYALIVVWLGVCYWVITKGWARVASRLFLSFAIALLFAVLPFFGPMFAIAPLLHEKCQPNEGNVGACTLFGGSVGNQNDSPAHDAISIGWLSPVGMLLTLGVFFIYAIFVIAADIRRKRRIPPPGR
jgi:hypothetical protein